MGTDARHPPTLAAAGHRGRRNPHVRSGRRDVAVAAPAEGIWAYNFENAAAFCSRMGAVLAAAWLAYDNIQRLPRLAAAGAAGGDLHRGAGQVSAAVADPGVVDLRDRAGS